MGDAEDTLTIESPRRVQVEFSPDAFRRLLEIKGMAGAPSNAEVIRDAIRLYEWFLRQRRENYKFQLVKGDTVKEVELVLVG